MEMQTIKNVPLNKTPMKASTAIKKLIPMHLSWPGSIGTRGAITPYPTVLSVVQDKWNLR